MSVTLRKRKNSDGSTSLLLDIYRDGKRQYEFLSNLKLLKPTTPLDRQENRERLQLAVLIKNKREQQIQADEYEVAPAFNKGIDFIKYFESFQNKYTKKDKRVIVACFHKFKDFIADSGVKDLTTKKVTPALIIQFKEYLEQNHSGETPSNYFKKFKKVLRTGIKDEIFSLKVSALLNSRDQDLSVKRNESIKKEILTFEEIQTLANKSVANDDVKRAFLFCCVTGLRFCDVKALQWKRIQNGMLRIIQQKTSASVSIPLNESAIKFIGKKSNADGYIFALPSHNTCLKVLRRWCDDAGIDKKITWHCARHSFGTGIVFHGGDVKNASSLLGHSSLTYTNRYVREAEKLKEKAVQNLPEINL